MQREKDKMERKYWSGTIKWLLFFAIAGAAIAALVVGVISYIDVNSDQITSLSLAPDPPPFKSVTFERIEQIEQIQIRKTESSSGLLLENHGKSYVLANTGVYSIDPGTGILIDDDNVHVPKISVDPAFISNCSCSNQSSSNVTLTSVGNGASLVDNGVGPDLTVKSIVGTNGITVTSNSTTISIEGAGISNTSSECFMIGLEADYITTTSSVEVVTHPWTVTDNLTNSFTGQVFNNIVSGTLDVFHGRFTVGTPGIYLFIIPAASSGGSVVGPPFLIINRNFTELTQTQSFPTMGYISLQMGDFVEFAVSSGAPGGTVFGPTTGNAPTADFYSNIWGMCLQGGSGGSGATASLASAGGDVSLVANGAGPNLETKGLIAGNDIILTDNGSSVTISVNSTAIGAISRRYSVSFTTINGANTPVVLQTYSQREMLIGVNIFINGSSNFAGGTGDISVLQAPGNIYNVNHCILGAGPSTLTTLSIFIQDDITTFTSFWCGNSLEWWPFSPTTNLILVNSVASDTYSTGTFVFDIVTMIY